MLHEHGSSRGTLLVILALLLAIVAALAWALGPTQPKAVTAGLSVADALGSRDVEGYARAIEPRTFTFPSDHGPHPAFRNEWWYFTGNVAAVASPKVEPAAMPAPTPRAFGFQLTFFRNRLVPLDESPPSGQADGTAAWRSGEVYMAHFALSDLGATADLGSAAANDGAFFAFERFRRPVVELAGAVANPPRIWVEGWSAQALGDPSEANPTWRLQAADGPVRLDLTVEPVKPWVLQGEAGLSRKNAEPGNASYYYSVTRLRTTGEISVEGTTYPVEGTAWLDREWSTSALAAEQVGWDWFALQLDDGRELMLYQLRLADGGVDPASDGVLIEPDGTRRALSLAETELTVTEHWTSPDTGVTYPAGWRLQLSAEGLDLTIAPRLADQELRLAFRYWEGSVTVQGKHNGANLRGVGYVELTGY